MKVYLKVHKRQDIETVACCDEMLLNTVLKEGNLKIEINDRFFGGDLLEVEKAVEILMQASYFNIVGKNICECVINSKLVPKEGVKTISGVPMAMKMMF
jgi:hypothetical protein